MMRKSVWLLSAGIFAMSTPAVAQDADTSVPSEAATPTTESPVEPAAVDDTAQVDDSADIVVTAQGRQQILQDVPIAVTAVGAESMKNSGATDIRQLNQLAPSLLVSSTGSRTNSPAPAPGTGHD